MFTVLWNINVLKFSCFIKIPDDVPTLLFHVRIIKKKGKVRRLFRGIFSDMCFLQA